MKKIGIGVSTYNRSSLLEKLVLKIRETIGTNDCVLIVADDGSPDNTIEILKKLKVDFISGPNMGPEANKNRLIRYLKDNSFVFIIEDDVEIYKSGWTNLYINAFQKTGIHHFIYCPEWYYGKSQEREEYEGFTLIHPPQDGGTFSFYTNKVFEVCGGFHPGFKGYGWGHCEFTERIHRAGLSGKYNINHIVQSEEYLTFKNNIPRANMNRNSEREKSENMKLWWKECRRRNLIRVEI